MRDSRDLLVRQTNPPPDTDSARFLLWAFLENPHSSTAVRHGNVWVVCGVCVVCCVHVCGAITPLALLLGTHLFVVHGSGGRVVWHGVDRVHPA